MSSSSDNERLRVFVANMRSIFNKKPSSSSSTEKDETHYQHGIPGIPTDGKVVLLKNSETGAQIYLVGTVHVCKESAETVKKVIEYVRPDVVAVELCKGRAEGFMEWKPKDHTLCKLFRRSIRASGGLFMKIWILIMSCRQRRFRREGISPGMEFKVALEESSRVGARCFCIDQDQDVMLQKLSKVFTFASLWKAYTRLLDEAKKSHQTLQHHADSIDVEYTRSFVQELCGYLKELFPGMFQVLLEDRDKFMLTNLRTFEGKVVAVVGMGHMEGIELLWKQAEEGGIMPVATAVKSEIEV